MAASVVGTFVILDRASGPMSRMRDEAQKLDRAVRGAGDSMDDFGTNKQMRQMEETERKLRDVDRNAELLGGSDGSLTKVDRHSRNAAAGLNLFTGRLAFMAAALVLALPLLIDLGGALVALAGSLGRATVGLGAFVTGAGAAGAVGLLGIATVIVPTIGRLGELNSAFQGLTEAQSQYGASSKEATDAAKELNRVQQQMRGQGLVAGPALDVLEDWDKFRERWMKSIRPGQRDFFGMMSEGMERMGSLMPAFAHSANRSMAAARDAVAQFFERLDGPEFRRFLDRMTTVVERTSGPLARSAANIGQVLGRVARAVAPELEHLARVLEDTTEGWVEATDNQGRLRQEVHLLTEEFGDWWKLLKVTWGWVQTLFGAGADEGQGLVKDMTRSVRESTKWMENHPRQMNQFFRQAVEGAKTLARLLGDFGPVLMDIANAMRPISRAIGDIVHFVASLNVGNLNALTVLLGGVVGSRLLGRVGGRGAPGMAPGMASPAIPVAYGVGSRAGMASPGLRSTYGQLRGSGVGAGAALGGALATRGGVGGIAGSAARGAGRFLAPVAGIMAFSDFLGTSGNLLDKFQGALSGATFGLLNAPETDAQDRRQGRTAATEFARQEGVYRVKTPAQAKEKLDVLRAKRRRLLHEDAQGLERTYTGELGGGLDSTTTIPATVEERGKTDELRRIQQDLLDTEKAMRNTRDVARAMDLGPQLAKAFDISRKDGSSPVEAFQETTDAMMGEFDTMGGRGRKRLSQNYMEWARQMRRHNPELKGIVGDLGDAIEDRYGRLGHNIEVVNGRILRGTKTEWKGIKDVLVNNVAEAQRQVADAFTQMQRQAVGSLKSMGYDDRQARQIVQGIESGNANASRDAAAGPTGAGQRRSVSDQRRANQSGVGSATGGRIPGGGWGRVLADNVVLGTGDVAAPSELVVNRHTEREVNRRLAGMTTLGTLVNNEYRHHSNPVTGSGISKAYATGGMIDPAGPGTGIVNPAIAGIVGRWSQKYNAAVNYGYDPGGGHVSPGHNVTGTATDVGPAGGWEGASLRLFEQGLRAIEGQVDQILYGTAGIGDPYPGHGRGDHAHIEWGGAEGIKIRGGRMGMAGGAVPQLRLRGRESGLGGIPGAMANAGMEAIRKGMEQKINRRLGARGGGAAGVYGGPNAGTLAMPQLERLAASVGMANPHLMAAIAMAESGGRVGVINSIGATGLWQVLQSAHPQYPVSQLTSARGNAEAAAEILKSQGLGAWEAYTRGMHTQYMGTGGRTGAFAGWFGSGLDATFSQPTMIGVGERGKERVQVTPLSGGSQRHGISIGQIVVQNNRDGDIKEQMKKEIRQAFDELETELDMDAEVDEDALIA